MAQCQQNRERQTCQVPSHSLQNPQVRVLQNRYIRTARGLPSKRDKEEHPSSFPIKKERHHQLRKRPNQYWGIDTRRDIKKEGFRIPLERVLAEVLQRKKHSRLPTEERRVLRRRGKGNAEVTGNDRRKWGPESKRMISSKPFSHFITSICLLSYPFQLDNMSYYNLNITVWE